ncbi:MAG: cytochrome c biogenesis protein CcdA [Armatimonadota bacterium]|nr:cytochrome c biogenesis protein CcdA [Armatimonadota bacterium]
MPDIGFLAFALSAGAAATLNPCGFAMLPAYVSYFLGREEGQDPPGGIVVGVRGGVAMTLGVLGVFATIGAILSLASRAILRYFPWATMAIGASIIILGLALLFRRSLQVGLPLANPVARRPDLVRHRSFRGLLLFGAGYGVASLGCTLPIFLVVVTQALAAGGVLDGVLVFAAYGLGMGAVLLALSLAVATGKSVIIRGLRGLMPHVRTLGAVGLVLAGTYLIYYQLTVGRALLLLR